MRIAIVINDAQSILYFRKDLILELISSGHEVIAFAPSYTIEQQDVIESWGAKIEYYPLSRTGMNPIREIKSIFSLSRKLRSYQPDLVLGCFLKPIFHAAFAGFLAGVPYRFGMVEGLGFAFTDREALGMRQLVAQKVVMGALACSALLLNKLLFLNDDDLNDFCRISVGRFSECVVIGGIGVNLDEWPQRAIPPKPLTFIMVARLLRDKGVFEYLEAARIIKQMHPAVRFLLLGGADDNPTSIDATDLLPFITDGIIEWPGHVAVKPWLSQSHVFVLPSYREGLPRSTQEAMAMGMAVITTNVPGCRQTVIDGRNGILVNPRESFELAQAILFFVNNFEECIRMGSESRLIACEKFDAEIQVRNLMNVMNIDRRVGKV